jgi:hypothetical protein
MKALMVDEPSVTGPVLDRIRSLLEHPRQEVHEELGTLRLRLAQALAGVRTDGDAVELEALRRALDNP